MAAPKGNKFWKRRTKHGRDKIFSSHEALFAACCEYFEWVESNPLMEHKVFQHQGVIVTADVPKMRAMTIGGLCIFLGINQTTWFAWRADDDFSDVIARAEEIIREQKFTGAAADLLNPNIIARDLGLRDKQDHEHSGKGGGPIDVRRITAEMDPVEASRIYKEFLNSTSGGK